MKEVYVNDKELKKAAAVGMDEFLDVFVKAIRGTVGVLTADTLSELNTSQITLLAYSILRDEVMDGGFVQLIYNGDGPFIFLNPFAKVMKMWGLKDFAKLVFSARKLYIKYHDDIEKECSDDEFMAMFEQFPEFDDLDDEFVEHEEEWTEAIARYVDEHVTDFAKITE